MALCCVFATRGNALKSVHSNTSDPQETGLACCREQPMGVEALRHARSMVVLPRVVVRALSARQDKSVCAERLMTVLRESAVFFSVRSRARSLLCAGARAVPLPRHSLRPWHRSSSHCLPRPSSPSLKLFNRAPSLSCKVTHSHTHTRLKNQSAFPRTLSLLLFFLFLFSGRNAGPHTSLSS